MSFEEKYPFCERLSDLHDHSICSRRLEAALDMQDHATQYAASIAKRRELSSEDDYWEALGRSWASLAESFDPGHLGQGWGEYLLAQTRMTRNAVAEVPENQENAFGCEPSMRSLLFKLTAHAWVKEKTYYPHTRSLTQAISNLVTSNDPLSERLWDQYMSLPDEQNVLIRLLSSPDTRTTSSAMILILNCTSPSPKRGLKLASTPAGKRTCITLLDRISVLFDASEDEESEESRAFQLGYKIFTHLFRNGAFEQLYTSVSIPSTPISPAQLILLKLFDSYTHNLPNSTPVTPPTCLVRALLDLSAHIRHLGEEEQPEVDVGQGIVLVAGCLNTVLLREDEEKEEGGKGMREALEGEQGDDGMGIVESLIDLLRKLSSLSPPVNPLKSSTNQSNGASHSEDAPKDGLAYVKRDLVRLLSTMSHHSRNVQDRVRKVGGIEVILGLCGLDERNPYLREHALFAIRNLLEGNQENQAVVEGLELQGYEDEFGAIKDLRLKEKDKSGAS